MKKFEEQKGFTLLELLVVVLIIGILAGIALPQYKKAVWKSRAKSMLPILRTMKNSIDIYYMTNDVYPSKLEELDIDLEGYSKTCSYLGPTYKTGGCKANDYLNLYLNVVVTGKDCTPIFQFNQGPYIGAGFFINTHNKIYCYEHSSYIPQVKSFCEKMMGCEFRNDISGTDDILYTCPDL